MSEIRNTYETCYPQRPGRPAESFHFNGFRALTDDKNIRRETREKVVALAVELGYTPNELALNLKQGRTRSPAQEKKNSRRQGQSGVPKMEIHEFIQTNVNFTLNSEIFKKTLSFHKEQKIIPVFLQLNPGDDGFSPI